MSDFWEDVAKAMGTRINTGHIPEPWAVCEDPPNDYWFKGRTIGAADSKDARRVADTSFLASDTQARANAEHIVACVNACVGINPEAVPDMYRACGLALENLKHGGLTPCLQELKDVLTQAIAKAERVDHE